MPRNRFIKTKSNYTFKKRHLNTDKGVIYERDYMTITNDSNFKFAETDNKNFQKKHNKYTVNEKYGKDSISDGKKIKLKSDYESLSDFACYGSAIELIKSSIRHIIYKFPAAIISIKKNFDGKDTMITSNPFEIDLFSNAIKEENNFSEIRLFSLNLEKYEIYYKSSKNSDWKQEDVTSWVSEIEGPTPTESCPNNLSIFTATINKKYKISKKYDEELGKWVYSTTNKNEWVLILKKEYINEAFSKLTDFEKILINRDTNPVYTANFKTPIETDYGIIMISKDYTWPTDDGWNLDLSGIAYNHYISSLLDLAEYHDENTSDNIWRSMTHESIKGLDWTFTRRNNEGENDINIDTSRIKPVLRIWGRQYDRIKRYIDTINTSNNISYNEKNNYPDYFLPDLLGLSGWEVKQVAFSDSIKNTVDTLYPGNVKKYNFIDVNTEFYRRLKLNSRSILEKKGTVRGLKELLSIFGFSNDEYSIKEYVAIAGGKYPKYSDVRSYNAIKDDFAIDSEDQLYGLPVKRVILDNKDEKLDYVIPWFNNGDKYDDETYFQMKGGWGAQTSKLVVNPVIKDRIFNLKSNADFSIYDETYPLIKIVNNLNELSQIPLDENLREKDIIYVTDISGMLDIYNFGTGVDIDMTNILENCSHYFYLDNIDEHWTIGFDADTTKYGWKNIPNKAFDNEKWVEGEETNDIRMAQKAIYIESILDETNGNNPHNGFGMYDGGISYFGQFRELLPSRKFSHLSENEIKELESKKIGFNDISIVEMKKKSYFFKDRLDKEPDIFIPAYPDTVDESYNNFYNPEGGDYNDDEAAANSIINVKNLNIIFNVDKYTDDKFKLDFKEFVRNKVMFYLKQIIPSTALLGYSFSDENENMGVGSYCTECSEKTGSSTLMGVIYKK